jgi:hypothetical protein
VGCNLRAAGNLTILWSVRLRGAFQECHHKDAQALRESTEYLRGEEESSESQKGQ